MIFKIGKKLVVYIENVICINEFENQKFQNYK